MSCVAVVIGGAADEVRAAAAQVLTTPRLGGRDSTSDTRRLEALFNVQMRRHMEILNYRGQLHEAGRVRHAARGPAVPASFGPVFVPAAWMTTECEVPVGAVHWWVLVDDALPVASVVKSNHTSFWGLAYEGSTDGGDADAAGSGLCW